MQGRLALLSSRRLRLFIPHLSSRERISSSSEEALTENFSTFNRERHIPASYKQNPSQNSARRFYSKPHFNPNPNRPDFSAENLEPKLESHPNSPKLVIDRSVDASLPDVEKRIWAVERLSKGKKYTRLDNKQNRVPGYVYEQDSPNTEHVLIVMDKFQIQNLWSLLGEERFLCTIFTLEVFDGFGSNKVLYQERVLPRRINLNKSGEISNVGFTKAPPGMKMRLDVPIWISGQEDCLGLKKGGFLKVYLSHVSLFCLPEELPQYVVINVNNMDIGDRIYLQDLKEQVPLHLDNLLSLPICEIIEAHT